MSPGEGDEESLPLPMRALSGSKSEMEFAAEQSVDHSRKAEGRPAAVMPQRERERGRLFIEGGRLYTGSLVGKNRNPGDSCKQLIVPSQQHAELCYHHDCPFYWAPGKREDV